MIVSSLILIVGAWHECSNAFPLLDGHAKAKPSLQCRLPLHGQVGESEPPGKSSLEIAYLHLKSLSRRASVCNQVSSWELIYFAFILLRSCNASSNARSQSKKLE